MTSSTAAVKNANTRRPPTNKAMATANTTPKNKIKMLQIILNVKLHTGLNSYIFLSSFVFWFTITIVVVLYGSTM